MLRRWLQGRSGRRRRPTHDGRLPIPAINWALILVSAPTGLILELWRSPARMIWQRERCRESSVQMHAIGLWAVACEEYFRLIHQHFPINALSIHPGARAPPTHTLGSLSLSTHTTLYGTNIHIQSIHKQPLYFEAEQPNFLILVATEALDPADLPSPLLPAAGAPATLHFGTRTRRPGHTTQRVRATAALATSLLLPRIACSATASLRPGHTLAGKDTPHTVLTSELVGALSNSPIL